MAQRARLRRATVQRVRRARSRTSSLVQARRRVQRVRWADTPQHRRWLVKDVRWASMLRLAVRQHVMLALLASIKILRAKATARCAWRDRGPTRVLLLVRACVLHVRPAHTPRHRTSSPALHVVWARSPTQAPALSRRYAPYVAWGRTQQRQKWRHVQPGSLYSSEPPDD